MYIDKSMQIFLLFLLVITISFPGNKPSSESNELTKNSYINKDVVLTRNIYFEQIISDLKAKLENEQVVNIEQLKRDYSGLLSFEIANKPLFNDESIYNNNLFTNKNALNNDKNFLLITDNTTLIDYKVIINPELLGQISKKQHSRIGTVTYIQNNRWKTTPTKYNPNKKLSNNINDNLPDLAPSTGEKGISHYIQNEVIIKFKDNLAEKEKEKYIEYLASKYQLKIKKKNNISIVAYCDKRTTKELIKTLEKNELNKTNSYIDFIEPDFIYLTNDYNKSESLIPNDSLYEEYQWNLPSIYTEEGWKVTRGKETVIVAVIDTGVDLNHPEFEGKLVEGINLINQDEPPQDDDGHGTHVAGIIAANTNNNEGIAGITWYNKIMPIKVLDQSGSGTLFDVAEAIFWATDNGAKVINLSLGNYAESEYLHEAIKYAYAHDVVLVAATGNDNTDELGYPAAYPEVIAVSATDNYLRRANFSNYGTYIDVMAPGVNIASTYPNNQYASLSGTSMASPHVAGLAALIRSQNPTLSNKEVENIIIKSTDDLGNSGKDEYYGYGEINIEKAVSYSNNSYLEKSIFMIGIKKLLRE